MTLRKRIHDFINDIMVHIEEPSNWPLTPNEQALFIKRMFSKARSIRNSDEYGWEEKDLAIEILKQHQVINTDIEKFCVAKSKPKNQKGK